MMLEGQTPPSVFVVFADPPPAREQEFHDWYDKIHGPDALENGSFTALHRFRAVGPGVACARFLALWIGQWRDEAEGWGYIRPRAVNLRDAGRVGDIASVKFGIMLFGTATPPSCDTDDVTALTTVQNDWRHVDPAESAASWWTRSGLDAEGTMSATQWLATSDPQARGPGYHLALFATNGPGPARSAVTGVAGTSPVPPYRTIFGEDAGSSVGLDAGPPLASTWTMHWEPIASLRS